MSVHGPTVEVRYSCPGCAIRERPVHVPERAAVEPVTEWIQNIVMTYVGLDHTSISPLCVYPKADLLLPYNDHLGRATRQ